MTRVAVGVGLVVGALELWGRWPTPGGAWLVLLVLGADAALLGAAAWLWTREGGAAVLAMALVAVVGAQDDEARQGARRWPSPAAHLVDGLRTVTDLDRDGWAVWLGHRDCAPFNAAVHPGAAEVPGNGIDDNCVGGDLAAPPPGPTPMRASRWPEGVPRPRGVLLVTIDSLRADHVGAYGYERATTPQLDALAARGAVFERAYTHTPATRWSLPMLHASRWPGEIAWDRAHWPHAVRRSNVTLAERLADRGVRTGASWPFRTSWGLRQGFEWWDAPKERRRQRGQAVVKPVRAFLDADDGRPWFLWVHLFDPHLPYRPAVRHQVFGDEDVDRYDGEIRAADHALSRLLAWVDARPGRRETTAIVVTADHGEEFQDHGGYAHHDRLYEELLRVPMIVSIPGVRPRRTPSLAGLLDVAPTILDLFGGGDEAPATVRGRSLLPDVFGRRVDVERSMFGSLAFFPDDPSRARSVRQGDAKLIFDPVSARTELYDLRTDPRERINVAAERPELTRRLLGELLPFIDRTAAP